MKVNKILLGFLGLGLLASCSQDDAPTMGGGSNIVDGNGKHLAININLPTERGTRAANDNFDDGLLEEYKVTDGCLLIFRGKSEDKATFGAAYNLANLNGQFDDDGDATTDNITTTYKKVVKLNNLVYDESDQIFAFVMLNYTNVATVTDENGLKLKSKDGEFTLNKTSKTSNSDGTVSIVEGTGFKDAFYKIVNTGFVSGEADKANYFFMCNAPLSNVIGGTIQATAPVAGNIFTMPQFSTTKLYDTEDEANSKDPACSIYVERGVAKASLAWTANGFVTQTIKDENGNDKDVSVASNGVKPTFDFIGWRLDVTEPESFIARKVDNTDWWSLTTTSPRNYRFVGHNPMGTTTLQPVENYYRTYWCYDPHYDINLDESDKPVTRAGESSEVKYFNNEIPLYCFENTFDLAHMNYKNTTRAVFQTRLKFGDKNVDTFYVLDGNESNIFLDVKQVESYPRKSIIESITVKEILEKSLKENVKLSSNEIESLLNIKFTRNSADGIRSVTTLEFNNLNDVDADLKAKFKDGAQPTFTSDQRDLLKANANAYKIEEYEGGNAYYDVRIQHFGDDLTPWNKANLGVNITETADAYDHDFANYLGRWGMVRNNWYELKVTQVKHLGSPVVPNANVTTSDDNNEVDKYLSFRINVLSWAKRVQNVEL